MDLYGGIEDTPAAHDVNNTNNSIYMSLNASQELYDPENPNVNKKYLMTTKKKKKYEIFYYFWIVDSVADNLFYIIIII